MAGNDGPSYAVQLLRPFWTVMRRYPEIPVEMIDRSEREFAVGRMPIAIAHELLRGAVVLTGDEDMGLKAARETAVGHFEVLEYVGASAATWGESAETFFRYAKLVNDAADFHLERHGDRAHIVLDSTVPLTRVTADFQAAAYYVAISRWVDPTPRETEVWLTHEEPADTSEYRATFGETPVRFSAAHDGLIFAASHLDIPLRTADPSLHRVLSAHADQLLAELAPGDSVVERVRSYILATMGEGRASAEDAARQLGMSRRTLTRRLGEQDLTFTQLLTDVRKRAATHYLEESEHSVEDIAFLLGFSESPPFVRAFKRWTGSPPLEYRRSRRAR